MATKCGSYIFNEYGEGECDLCAHELVQKVFADIRADFEEWYDSRGHLKSPYHEQYLKRGRRAFLEKQDQVRHKRLWKFSCGFCFEPFGICVDHLKEILAELEKEPEDH